MGLKQVFFDLIVFVVLIWTTNLYSQKVSTIMLDKKVHEFFDYNPEANSLIISGLKKSSTMLFLAGDYSDSVTKFRIVVIHFDDSHSDKTPTGEKAYSFYVVPYQCDSVYLGYPSISASDATADAKHLNIDSCIVGIGKRKFKVNIVQDGKAIQVTALSDKNIKPDIKLFENKLPDVKYTLFDGRTESLTALKHQRKFIYLFFWNFCTPEDSIQGLYHLGQESLNSLDTLKKIYDNYKKDVIIVALGSTMRPYSDKGDIFDTNALKTTIVNHKLEYPCGFDNYEIDAELFISGMSGRLFDEDRNLVKMNTLPSDLRNFLGKAIAFPHGK